MRYKVVENNEIFDSIEDVLDYCIDESYHEDDDYFEEWCNNEWGSIEINGDTYWAYDILDNDNYNRRDAMNRFCECMNDEDRDQAMYELQHASDGDEIDVQGYTVIALEDEDYGDEPFDVVAACKLQLEEEQRIKEEARLKEVKDEQDLMDMLQVIK